MASMKSQSSMAMPSVAVLAGGLATRLRPITLTIPKSMVIVAGEPFIAHQLRLFRREGLSHVVLCIGHLGETIEKFVGDGSQFGLEVAYSRDGECLLGTGGALTRALPLLGPEFLVTYGDSYLDIAYAPVVAAFRESSFPVLMTVFRNADRWEKSNIDFSAGLVRAYSKTANVGMSYIDYGLQMVDAEILRTRRTDEPFDLASVYAALVGEGRMAGFEVSRRFYEIGSQAGLAETEAYLATSLDKVTS
jgi:NDP-sugar pyrophosphorylase family protein